MKRSLLLVSALFFLTSLSTSQTVDFTSSNLPIVVINTGGQTILDDPKITADMGIIFNGPGLRNNLTDSFNNYNGKIGIELRGHSSQMFPMKSYGFECRDINGKSVDKSILGMPKESDWVLYAPYTDKTLMRNFLAYTIAREMGGWAARTQFVEVVLNGEYVGVYVLMEKIKRNSNRVNIAKMADTDVDGDGVTGGYIFSIDKDADAWFSSYTNTGGNGHTQYGYVYPKLENIVQEQRDYLKSYVDSFEKAVASTQFQDPQHGWRQFGDVASFIDYYLVNEVSRNVDGYRLSTFLYKDRKSKNGKIFAGPVWDYDLAFRNADYCDGSNTDGWAYEFNSVCPADYWGVPFFWERIIKDTAFEAAMRCRYKSLRQSTLSASHLDHLIDSVVQLVNEAQQRHFTRWPVLGQYIWPNASPIPTSYEGEISALKSWLASRLAWIDENLANVGACSDWPKDNPNFMIADLYPNPILDPATLVVRAKERQTIHVIVTDITGKTVEAFKSTVDGGSNNVYQIRTGSWQRGVYILRVMNDRGEKLLKRLVK